MRSLVTPVLGVGLLLCAGSASAWNDHGHPKRIVVHPGESIQAAIDQAQPGDVVAVWPGTYQETGRPCPSDPGKTCAIVITSDGIRLMGLRGEPWFLRWLEGSGDGEHGGHGDKGHGHPGRVVIKALGDQDRGIEAARSGASGGSCLGDPTQRIQGVRLRNLDVDGFKEDGIFILCADDWEVRNCGTHDDFVYGIFPSHTGVGRVTGSTATGANDTGIYIGQSSDVRIDHNVASGNVSGFELENSTHMRMDHNDSHDNTAGLLTFANPGLDVKVNADNRVDHNDIRNNNKANTCPDPSDDVCQVPPGTGILMLATDRNLVDHNTVQGNNSYGIATISQCLLNPATCDSLDVEPNPDGNRVVHNVSQNNGASPDPSVPPFFAKDLAWDASGNDNCWSDNVFGTSFPKDLPACPAGEDGD